MEPTSSTFIDESAIEGLLVPHPPEAQEVRAILSRAREGKGLEAAEVAALMRVEDPELTAELYASAKQVKEQIYGPRLVLFAPLYISNLCGNDCVYCSFRSSNKELSRRALDTAEITREVESLVDQGHKRVLLVAGEAYPNKGFRYVLDAIEAIYAVRRGHGEVRRVNVNVAPLEVEQYQQLRAAKIGTYQLFQETYHRATYAKVHPRGRKKDYDWRVTVMDRAMEGGINDVGIGALFGLYHWRFEVLAMLQHIRHLEQRFGVGPHTISVPRIEPAWRSPFAEAPPHQVSDENFKRLVAILRLAVPYTGIILSTREGPEMRREAFALGVSQISAGSRTSPGGYQEDGPDSAQFCVGDHRSLEEVIRDVASMGYVPSFCTGCYRLGRTGKDFMDLARPGEIKAHCDPNALSTFLEYLLDYATPPTRDIGEGLIRNTLDRMEARPRAIAEHLLQKVRSGNRDAFC